MLIAAAAIPARAQHPGSNANDLPPHVREQLWPEQHLTRPKQELKQRTLVARDTLTRVEADAALIQRQRRGSRAVLASTARTLLADCQRAARTAKWLQEYAATLSTSDGKWGPQAIQGYKTGIVALENGMNRCAAEMAVETKRETVDPDRLVEVSQAAQRAIASYRTAEQRLLKTLDIKIDPRERPVLDSL